jgi:hypothetical protein
MILTIEQEAVILQDLREAFEQVYGDRWMFHLTDNLRPSPIPHIARKHGVSLYAVRKLRSQMLVLGQLFQLYHTLFEPISPPSLDESFSGFPYQSFS